MAVQITINTLITTPLFCVVVALYAYFLREALPVGRHAAAPDPHRIRVADVVLAVALVVATGLRYDVGADWQNYYGIYEQLRTVPNYIDALVPLYGADSGFWLLCDLLAKSPLGASPYGIFWMTASLVYPATVVYIRKKTTSAPWALAVFLFLGFFGISLSMLRHAAAAVAVLWALEALHADWPAWRRWAAFAALSLVACAFHLSALFAVAVILVARHVAPTRRLLVGALAAGGVLLAGYLLLWGVADSGIPFLGRFSQTITKMDTELQRDYMWMTMVCYLVLYALLAWCMTDKRLVRLDARSAHMTSCVILALPITVVAIVAWPFNRMAVFLYQFSLVLIPLFIASVRQTRPRLVRWVAVGMLVWHVLYCYLAWNVVTPFVTYLGR